MANSFQGGVDVEWHGDGLNRKLVDAEVRSVRELMGDCVRTAVPRAPIKYGFLRRSIYPEPVEVNGTDVSGVWGSHGIEYALPQEKGTAQFPGKFYLQSAADDEYPTLGARIKRNLGR